MSGNIISEERVCDNLDSFESSDFRAGIIGRPSLGTTAIGLENPKNKDDEQNEYPVLKHPTEILEKSRRKHLLDAVNASVAATKNDAKTERKNSTQNDSEVGHVSDLTGRQVEAWEVAYFNGAAILDEIPVANREQTDQIAFRDRGESGFQILNASRQRRPGLDANRYATKKTIAQGMLDVALLTANASQLKYVLQLGPDKHPFYELMLSLIVISIILQVVAGVLFLVIGGLSINEGSTNQKTADILNDVIVVVIFIITLINVVISGFGIRATDEGQIKL